MTAPTTRRQPAASSPPSGQQAQAQAHRQAYHRRKTRAKAKSEALQSEGGRPGRSPARATPARRRHRHRLPLPLGLRRLHHRSRFLPDSRVPCPYGWPESHCRLPAGASGQHDRPGIDRHLLDPPVRVAPGRGVRGPPGRSQLQPPIAGTSQDGPPGLPVDLPAAQRRPAGGGLPARRADLPVAGLPAAAGQPDPLRPAGTCSTCRRPWSR